MDFFGAQERAKWNSFWLGMWFLLATFVTTGAVYLFISFFIAAYMNIGRKFLLVSPSLLDFQRFLWISPIVGGGILVGSLYKIAQIARQGAGKIVRDLGGDEILRKTQNPLEQRLCHIVDEISIAASIVPPRIFVLKAEPGGINAFAIGSKASESVIAVTQGMLEHLSRDEQQSVIAHEMSHIINNDIRLNLQLIGLLHGLLMSGMLMRFFAQAMTSDLSHSSKNMSRKLIVLPMFLWILLASFTKSIALAPLLFLCLLICYLLAFFIPPFAVPILFLFTLPFWLLGSISYIGVFFAKLIKSAISRQREFLADAAAVQFTRNPQALAGALRKIAHFGSRIQHPRAEVVNHMFFSMSDLPSLFSRLFATHPPIVKRLACIERDFPAADFAYAKNAPYDFNADSPDLSPEGAELLIASVLAPLNSKNQNAKGNAPAPAIAAPASPAPLAYAHAFFATLPLTLQKNLESVYLYIKSAMF
jgi:Zn-dependent protease with chaperone function